MYHDGSCAYVAPEKKKDKKKEDGLGLVTMLMFIVDDLAIHKRKHQRQQQCILHRTMISRRMGVLIPSFWLSAGKWFQFLRSREPCVPCFR